MRQLVPGGSEWGLFSTKSDGSGVMGELPLGVADLSGHQGYTKGEILEMGRTGFERFLDSDPSAAHWNRIALYLWADDVAAARDACQQYYEALPDEWPAVLLWALVTGETDRTKGDAILKAWVAGEPGLPRYVRLAQYYELMGRADALAGALHEAAQHNEGDFRYFYGRLYYTAAFALSTDHPDAAIVATDAMLKQIDKPEYGTFQDDVAVYRALREAATKVEAGAMLPLEALRTLDTIYDEAWGDGRHLELPAHSPYVMLEKLLQRPVPRLTGNLP